VTAVVNHLRPGSYKSLCACLITTARQKTGPTALPTKKGGVRGDDAILTAGSDRNMSLLTLATIAAVIAACNCCGYKCSCSRVAHLNAPTSGQKFVPVESS